MGDLVGEREKVGSAGKRVERWNCGLVGCLVM